MAGRWTEKDLQADDGHRYKIKRYYQDDDVPSRVVVGFRNMTIGEVRRRLSDPETSSKTCTKASNIARTEKYGPWFEGYTED